MERPWATPFKNREEARTTLNPMGLAGHICWWLGGTFAVLGIVAGAKDIAIGLQSMNWLVLAIAAFVAGIPMWLTWSVALRLLGIEDETKKKD